MCLSGWSQKSSVIQTLILIGVSQAACDKNHTAIIVFFQAQSCYLVFSERSRSGLPNASKAQTGINLFLGGLKSSIFRRHRGGIHLLQIDAAQSCAVNVGRKLKVRFSQALWCYPILPPRLYLFKAGICRQALVKWPPQSGIHRAPFPGRPITTTRYATLPHSEHTGICQGSSVGTVQPSIV